jgi:hypothetical protein
VRVRTFFVLFAAFLVLAASGVAWSQTVQGVITGAVTDPTGAVVPGAAVTITNAGTNVSQSTTTGSDGSYRFPLVPPGTYIIEVKAANFARVRASGVVVEASQTVPFSVKLELAKASEMIEVTSQAPLVQTSTSDLSTQVDRLTIENAPLVNRDVFATLPFLAPQVSPGLDMGPTSGGARESGTSYLLNGADNNDNFSEGGINIHPPLESVEDFSILTNSMSAQYGRGNGAVVTANQKSGTNKFHGALYEYNRNASFNAADFFFNASKASANAAKPKYIRNQYGGEIDGPIFKDKTFFSFALDRIDLRAGSALTATTFPNIYVPTTAGLKYATTNASPLAKQILSTFPPLTSDAACPGNPQWTDSKGNSLGPQTGAGTNPNNNLPNTVGCINFFDPATDKPNSYFGRIDHNFSASDRISFSANILRESSVDKYGGGGINSTGPINASTINHFHQLSLNETHVFNPRLLNEVTIAHNRHFNTFVEGNGTDTVPETLVDNSAAGCLGFVFGPGEGGLVQGFTQDRWSVQDNLTWTIGRHSLKLGGGNQYGILYRNWDLGGPGYYESAELYNVNGGPGIAPNTAGNPACPVGAQLTASCDGTLQSNGTIAGVANNNSDNSNFTSDYPYFQETSINPANCAKSDAYRHYTYHDYYTFIQDDWKISPRLTLNLGLRWDRYGAPAEDHGIMAQFTNLNCNILDPTCVANARVGPVARMWKTRNGDFGPRVGFAWDPFGKGKTAVRGSYGIYYDRIFDNIWSNGAWNPPFYALIDFNAAGCDSIFYSNPDSIGGAYDPTNPIPHPGKRVSVRTMDVKMKDSSSQNFGMSVERQFFGGLLFRVGYQGSMGRHLPMLENYNREDGIGYIVSRPNSLSVVRPNALYTGFNYRSNSVSSSYHAMVAEAQKRMGHGLQFQTGFTWSKLLDLNSELFAGCSTIGGFTAPYYYVSNAQPNRYRGPASFDHRQAYKFNVTYELPILKNNKGFAGRVLGGWTVASFYQLYAGHPVDVINGASAIQAKTLVPVGGIQPNGATCTNPTYPANNPIDCVARVYDQNGVVYNIGGDYNLDGVLNDHPVFLGTNPGSAYSGANPHDGIFTDNNKIGCGFPGMPSNISVTASSPTCPGTPNTLFGNPAYPTGATPFLRFGSLGRGVFHGPRFQQMDMSLAKTFRISERWKVDIRASAENVLNHPSFDCVQGNLNSGNFGKAQCLAQNPSGATLGAPTSRIMSVGADIKF